MSIHGFKTNPETLLFLGWAACSGVRRALIEEREKATKTFSQCDYEAVLRAQLRYSSPPVFESDSVYGPIYEALFEHRLNQVELNLVDWALRGFNAVYLRQPDPDQQEADVPDDSPTPETDLLWNLIKGSERVFMHVKRLARDWKKDVRHGANVLRLHFTYRTPLLLRTSETAFLMQEFVSMSLSLVNWFELAALVLDIPYTRKRECEEEVIGDDEALLLALLKETIWRGHIDLGDLSQYEVFAQSVADLCLNLSDQCRQTHSEIQKLEAAGAVYEFHEKKCENRAKRKS